MILPKSPKAGVRDDPVHLWADLKQVLLSDGSHWDIEPAQAQLWIAELNAYTVI
ncbi:MAG: hypothetical protein R3F37_01610 [Candidatus Competibacteraceae bacterium]